MRCLVVGLIIALGSTAASATVADAQVTVDTANSADAANSADGAKSDAAKSGATETDPNAVNAKSPPSRSLGIDVSESHGGIEVTKMSRNSTGDYAGLRVGDRIVAIDGRRVASLVELNDAIRSGEYQSSLLLIMRNGAVQRLPVNWTTGTVRRTTGNLGLNDATKFSGTGNGVRIIQVVDGSWAQLSGLRVFDRIVSVNRTQVTSMSHLVALLDDAAGSAGIAEMVVDRGGTPTTLQLHFPSGAAGSSSLRDMSNLIGTRGDVDSGAGTVRGRLGPYGLPDRNGSPNTSNGSTTAGDTAGGSTGAAATSSNGSAGTLPNSAAPAANLGNTSGTPNAASATAPGQLTPNAGAPTTASGANGAGSASGNLGTSTGGPAAASGGAGASSGAGSGASGAAGGSGT